MKKETCETCKDPLPEPVKRAWLIGKQGKREFCGILCLAKYLQKRRAK